SDSQSPLTPEYDRKHDNSNQWSDRCAFDQVLSKSGEKIADRRNEHRVFSVASSGKNEPRDRERDNSRQREPQPGPLSRKRPMQQRKDRENTHRDNPDWMNV